MPSNDAEPRDSSDGSDGSDGSAESGRPGKPSRSGRASRQAAKPKDFSRPELTTGWQKFTGNTAVRVIAAVVLVGGSAALLVAAITMTR